MQSEIVVEGYRVSVQQERLWRLCEEYGEAHFRSTCAIWLPSGVLSRQVLERTFVELLRRHESLRTSFRRLAALAAPLQCVLDDVVLDEVAHRLLEYTTADDLIDANHDDDDRARRVFDAWVENDGERSFDLSEAPLLRATVVEFERERYLLCVSASALVVDREALAETARQWVRAYAATGTTGNQEQEPVLQYADYAQWQFELFASEETRDGREFWRHALEGVSEPPPLGFLGGAQTPTGISFSSSAWRPARVSFASSAALRAELDHAARLCDAEPRDLLEAAWRTLLWRLCDRPAELTLGVGFDGRGFAELRGAVGAFARDLPVRIAMKAEQNWRALAGQVRREREEAAPRQEFFDWSGVSSDETERKSWWVGRRGFGFEFAGDDDESPESRSFVGSRGRREVFCLLLRAGLSTEGLCCEIDYDAGVINAQQAGCVLQGYEAMLRGACASVDARLRDLSATSPAELAETSRRNRTEHEFDGYPALLHQLVEEQARRTPESVAIECGAEVLSYAEVDARSETLAALLRQKGIDLEARVALLMERSVDAVVALLAVLKSGGAYVPLDPEYPHERLALMLKDSGARVVLTQRRVAEADWLAGRGVEAVVVDELELKHESEAIAHDGSSSVSPQNVAYVIYTSGSTGTPKGVMVSHEAIRNRLLWMQQRFPLNHDDKVLLKTSLSFDASIWELFSPLLAGARVVLAEPGGQRDPDYLVREVQRRGITVLQMVPSMWRELAAEGVGLEQCKSLRRVYSGGEALGRELAERLRAAVSGAELVNLYGPTEAAIDASYWLCRGGEAAVGAASGDDDGGAALDYGDGDYVGAQVVIGRPVANMALYVLDEGLKFCAAGEAGELYLSGVGLARGYLNRASLTAERFVPDPHAARPGARMYRTGDVARRLGDGRVAYVGRADGQVKVRGYRVELGEVEAALRGLAGVREAVAVGIGTERLVAYVVADRNGHSTNGDDLLVASDTQLETLPNGIRMYQLNRNETDVLYQEIFEQQSYLRHGVTVQDGDCVFDVGANIGMFTVFVNSRCTPSRVYAFEPIPETHEVLRRNLELHRIKGQSFVCALSSYNGTAQFTYYPRTSTMSGAYANAAEDERVSRAFLRQQHEGMVTFEDELMEGRFETREVNVLVRTLSDVIRSENIERIDLLKIDVEKSELDVLQGIEDADWDRIVQLVIEVHDESDRIAAIERLLAAKGFAVEVEEDLMLKKTGLYNIYAIHTRRAAERAAKVAERSGRNGHNADFKGTALDVEELRMRLAERLPRYMVPSQIIVLEDLPVLANGKVDRNALLAPDTASRPRSKPYVAPRTMVEEVIAGIWASLLATDQISRNDDFFELGGHSLRATQLVSRLRKSFGVEVPLRVIFETPKLSDIAAYVDSIVRTGQAQEVAPIIAVARDQELPLSFAQQRLWFLDQLQPNSAFYNLPAAVRLTGNLNVTALEQSFNEIVRRHEALRTTFTSQDGTPLQVIAPSLQLTLPLEDLSEYPADEREAKAQRTATEEVQRPFDLTRGPLLRVKLLRMAEHEHILLLTMHHIVSDGWSGSILIRELVALYQAFANGQPSPLIDPVVQYADFAYWQRESLQGDRLDTQLEYWRRQLAGAPAALELPTDRPRPAIQTVRGAHHRFSVSADVTKSLKELSQREGATLFMALLAAFKTLLYRFTGQEDIVVGTPIAGRNRIEIEGLIGFFVNTLVLRTDLSGEPTFQELVARVRQTALGASAHQDLPFEKLVEELQPERDLSRTPLFQVMFVLQNKSEDVYELPDLKVQAAEVQTGTAKFDFELFFEEREDELAGTCEYNADLFDASTVERMTQNLDVLLRAIVNDPKQQITRIPILSESERRDLFENWVDTFSEYPRSSVVTELF
ncbi:MAG TPA: amino acid adenylation domain-containing protein, partial [Pyrinomonadaceae bacterium]|nr:amino acid adenylation domain-containing protein [Pyrinomonadaceae bacterium]